MARPLSGLIAGQDGFRGLAPGAQILHARAFEKGRSNADAILASIDWAAEQKTQIINMSFEGPRNRLMEATCAAAASAASCLSPPQAITARKALPPSPPPIHGSPR